MLVPACSDEPRADHASTNDSSAARATAGGTIRDLRYLDLAQTGSILSSVGTRGWRPTPPRNPPYRSVSLFVDVGDPVVVVVAFFILTDVAIVPISSAQQN